MAARADLRNGRVFVHDNLWSTGDEQYAAWTAPDGTPYVAKRQRGSDDWQIENLARLPGNPLDAPTHDDLHNVYSVAVDSLGYVHVVGNMHNDPLRYIRSTRPRDLTGWETATMPGPTEKVTYPTFVELLDGSLLFFHREGISGDGYLVYDLLPAGSRTWQHRGVLADGRPTQESAYVHEAVVDRRSGTLHLMYSWRIDGEADSTNDLGYLRSEDGGRTWETSEGKPVELPLTHGSAETILDTAPKGSGMRNHGGVTIDEEGQPHGAVLFEPRGRSRRYAHVWLDGSTWRRRDVGDVVDARPGIVATRDGGVWLLGARGSRLVAVDLLDGDGDGESDGGGRRRDIALARPGWEVSFDAQALRLHGTVEVLVPDGDEPLVAVADLE